MQFIREYHHLLTRHSPHLVHAFEPVLAEEVLFHCFEAASGLMRSELNPELSGLYSVMGGLGNNRFPVNEQNWLFPWFALNSPADAIRNAALVNEFFHFEEKRLLPVFNNGGGEYLCISLGSSDTRVFYYSASNGPDVPFLFAPSVEQMFAFLCEAFKQGLLFVNAAGIWDVKLEFYEWGKTFFPDCDFWTGDPIV